LSMQSNSARTPRGSTVHLRSLFRPAARTLTRITARCIAAFALAALSTEAVRADPYVFVPHRPGPNNPELVFAVDLSTGAVNPIPIGFQNAWSTAVSPNGRLQLVRFSDVNGNYNRWDVSIIDTQMQRAVGTFAVREPAGGVAIAPR